MSVTFEVGEVARSSKLLDEVAVLDAVRARVGRAEAAACNATRVSGASVNPFVHAAHLAFEDHHELELSPDDVWLCLAQGFAQHVNRDAEALRGRFVKHEGKARIVVRRDEFRKGSPDNDWPGVFGEFSEQIAKHVGKKRDLVVADFSTTGPVEKAASEVVLMATLKYYFDYSVHTLCGIPRVTLHGTVADWQSVRTRARNLAEYGLEHWVRALEPILDELCAAAAGKPDRAMWQSFYKFESGSGGDRVTGWINTLFPYLVRSDESGELDPNPHVAAWQRGRHGPSPNAFPTGLAIAPFTWKYYGEELPMEFVAGFMAVSQDPDTHAVRPAIGWAVRDAAS